MDNILKIYQGKKVFVTGHTGFKGSWLSLCLKELGADVTGYALDPPTKENFFEICKLDKMLNSITGDIRNIENLKKTIATAKPEIVFHLAAQALVIPSYNDPIATYETNVMGTANVLEACRQCPSVKVIVIVTSDKCYENKGRLWWGYRENDSLGGYDPYSSSKGCAELVTSAYRNSFFNPSNFSDHGVVVSSARGGNVIGGGDWARDRLVPDCIRSFLKNEPICIRSPYAVRPWQHVFELNRGYMVLGARMWQEGVKFSGSWNFGPKDGSSVQVEYIADAIVKIWGGSSSWKDVSEHNGAPHEAALLKLDIAKAKCCLGWLPKLELQETLEMTINWYKTYYESSVNILDFSRKQLHHYLQLK